MTQETQTGTLYQPRGVGWSGRWERGSKERDLFWGLTENKKILLGNYPSIKKFKIKKKGASKESATISTYSALVQQSAPKYKPNLTEEHMSQVGKQWNNNAHMS